MKKTEINFEFVKKVVYDNPNNYILGEKLRKIILDMQYNKNEDKKTEPTQLPK